MEEIKKDNRREIKTKKYLLVFLLTMAIFITGIVLSKQFEGNRMENIKNVEDSMYIDILSSEIQFDLLEDAGCKGLTEKTVLSSELRELSNKISFMEKDLKVDDDSFISLKKKYQLLQIKDYLLMKKLSKKCNLNPINILYFYSNKEESSEETRKQAYVLDRLENDNPRLRVYYFDYDLPFSPVRALIISKKVSGENLPALVIEDKIHEGFQGIEKIQKLLPKLEIKDDEEYLNYLNGGDSGIKISCQNDNECILSDKLITPCQQVYSININNDKKDLEFFNKKQAELIKDIKFKCMIAEKIENFKFSCDIKKNLCKKEIIDKK
ncbi:MAG TPA: hypothetical protein EYG72_01230 [Candidatus Pacebacteria bacterium]|nr:hypothetical protein [Candidatus Paceibacterota bacterium]